MKHFFLLALTVLLGINMYALNNNNEKNKTTKIIIKDAITQEALPGVAIKVDGIKEVLYSDLNGELAISGLSNLKYNLTISYVSYSTSQNTTVLGGSDKNIILLTPAK
jgi:hypothetical protein